MKVEDGIQTAAAAGKALAMPGLQSMARAADLHPVRAWGGIRVVAALVAAGDAAGRWGWEMTQTYAEFIHRKSQVSDLHGFEPEWMPPFLFDFQLALVEWAIRKGRAAIFADCGLGKTPMQLVWAWT